LVTTQDGLRTILDLEQIKQLKGKYFRYLDSQRWEDWGNLFTEDAKLRLFPINGGEPRKVDGRATIVADVSGRLKGVVTVHHGHTPVIEFTGADTAHGSWAMSDDLEEHHEGGLRVHRGGYGYYLEDYKRDNGTWRIAVLRLTRIRLFRVEETANRQYDFNDIDLTL
jgi:hypothetical protein